MKILHTADLHLREKDIDEAEKCLSFMVEKAKTAAVDLVVIAGDVFHSQDCKMDSKTARVAIQTVSALADIAPVAIILGTASHDGKAPEILRFARGKFRVKVASVPEQILLYQGCFYDHMVGNLKADAVLTLIPQPTKQFFQSSLDISATDQEIGEAMSVVFAGFGASATQHDYAPHLLVGHFNVNGCRLANGQIRTGMDIEVSVDQMNLGLFDIGLLGHIHIAQELGGTYYYPGPIYATKIDEDGPKGFYLHDTVAEDCSLAGDHRFIETPYKRIARFKYDRDGGIAGTSIEEIKGANVRIDIEVWQEEAGGIDKDELIGHYLALGAESVDIHITAVPRVNVRAEAVMNATTLRGEFEEMAKLRGEDPDPYTLVSIEHLEFMPVDQLLAGIAGGAI